MAVAGGGRVPAAPARGVDRERRGPRARRRIKSGGDVKAALALMPVTKPVFAQYRAMLEAEYPHLVV